MPILPIPSQPPVFATVRAASILLAALFLAAVPLTTQASPDAAGVPMPTVEKRDSPANRLLLPFYVVDANNPSGASTLWALRNESLLDLTVTIEYYEADSPQAPQHTDVIVLDGKEIRTGNLRDVPDLEEDPDGFKRGYVLFQAQGNAGDLYGDYFVITSDQDFAEGSLLLDAGESADSDLCNLFSLRFITGGAFGGSTEVVVWVEADAAPLEPGTVTYSVYDSAGQLLVPGATLFLDNVTSRFDVSGLVGNLTGGAIEVQFAQGVRGHVAVAVSAFGRYSAGYDAVCKS